MRRARRATASNPKRCPLSPEGARLATGARMARPLPCPQAAPTETVGVVNLHEVDAGVGLFDAQVRQMLQPHAEGRAPVLAKLHACAQHVGKLEGGAHVVIVGHPGVRQQAHADGAFHKEHVRAALQRPLHPQHGRIAHLHHVARLGHVPGGQHAFVPQAQPPRIALPQGRGPRPAGYHAHLPHAGGVGSAADQRPVHPLGLRRSARQHQRGASGPAGDTAASAADRRC